jgi:hypothetical protein
VIGPTLGRVQGQSNGGPSGVSSAGGADGSRRAAAGPPAPSLVTAALDRALELVASGALPPPAAEDVDAALQELAAALGGPYGTDRVPLAAVWPPAAS